MKLVKTSYYEKKQNKFFKKHPDLLKKYANVLKRLQQNPFDESLKTHKLKGELKELYACSLTYEYRIILTIKIVEDKIILVNIGSHDEVYQGKK